MDHKAGLSPKHFYMLSALEKLGCKQLRCSMELKPMRTHPKVLFCLVPEPMSSELHAAIPALGCRQCSNSDVPRLS